MFALAHSGRRSGGRASGPRRGAIAVKVAVLLPVLFGVIALAFDGGMTYDSRRHVQAAADAAALAAAGKLFQTYGNTNLLDNGKDLNGDAAAAALAVAAANGYPNDGKIAKVTVNIPPTSGPFAGVDAHAEVIIEYFQPRSFSAIFAKEKMSIGGRAVARGKWYPSSVGILVMDPTSSDALSIGGGAQGYVPNANVVVNSSNSSAAMAGGGGTITAQEFDVTGGIVGSDLFNGTQYTGVPPTPDPYASVPEPDPTLMPRRSDRIATQYQYTVPPVPPPLENYSVTQNGVTTYYLYPGVYSGGIKYTQGNAYLYPGVFYMGGSGFEFSGLGSLTALNVMLFNDPGNNNGSISITGQGAVTWTPPADGVYQGITLFQKRGATTTVTISGGGNMHITGILYVPDALLKISGNGTNYIGNQLICWQLSLQGNGSFNVPWDANALKPVRDLRLVE